MNTRHTRLLSVMLPLAWLGCTAQPGFEIAQISLQLAQTAGIDFIEVRADQAGRVTTGAPNADGEIELTIRSGIEAKLSLAVFDTAPQLWRDFEGTHIFVPQPGRNEIEIDTQEIALRHGSILPSLLGPLATVPWRKPQALVITDKLTGFGDSSSFIAATPLALPEGRTFTIALNRPDTGEQFTFDLTVRGDFGDVNVPAGLAPELPPPFAISSPSSIVDLAAALGASDDFPFSCAVGAACVDSLDWGPCDPLNLQALIVGEGRIDIWVRYADLKELGCTQVEVNIDSTPPTASLSFDPPVIDDGNPPASVRVRLLPSEPLTPNGLSVLDELGNTYDCTPFTSVSVPGSAIPAHECTLDTSSWTVARGDLRVTANGSDLAGNQLLAPVIATLRHLPLTSGSSLKIIGVRTFPDLPNARDRGFLLGIEVINAGTDWLCGLDALTVIFPGAPDAFFIDGAGSPQLSRLAPSDATGTRVGTLWLPVETYQMTPLEPGRFDVELQVQGLRHSTRACDDTSPLPIQSDLASFSMELAIPPLAWVNDGPIGLAVKTWDQGSAPYGIQPPLAGGSRPSELDYPAEISDPVVAFEVGEESRLRGLAPGSASVRVTDPRDGAIAETLVEVSPPPELLLLHENRLTRLTPTNIETLVLDPAIHPEIIGGQGNAPPPIKVLWEPSRDLILVVGHAGVQRLPASPVSSVIAPCGALVIHDAAISAETPANGQQPGLVLLTEGPVGTFKHCTVSLDDWGQTQSVIFNPLTTCGVLERLQADALTDRFVAVGRTNESGPVCAVQYRTDGTAPIDVIQQTGISRSPATAAALDPYGNFLAVGSSPAVLAGWQLGFAVSPTADLDLAAGGTALELHDLVIDPASGAVIAVTANQAAVGGFGWLVHRFDNRFETSAPVQRSDLWTTTGLAVLALDAGNRVLYVVDDGSPANVRPIHVDNLSDLGWASSLQLPLSERVVDATIAGPQLIGVEPRLARPGSIAVARGLGFAGQNRDQVFVNGIPAEVLSSTTTQAVFRVPAAFKRLGSPLEPVMTSQVTVRSHGRMSGPGPYDSFAIRSEVPAQLLELQSVGYMSCNDCTAPALFDGPGGFFAARSAGSEPEVSYMNPAGGSFPITGAGIGPSSFALVNGGQRLIGLRGADWTEIDLVTDGSWYEPARLGPSAPSGITAMAGDPSGSLAALGLGTSIRLYSSTSQQLLRSDLPNGVVSPKRIAFMADGSAVVTAASGGAIDVFPLTGPAAVHSPARGGSCPSGTLALLGLWPRSVPQQEVVAVFGTATGNGLTLATVSPDSTGGYSYSCASTVTLADGRPLIAALSPLGDALAVVVDAGAARRLLLLDAYDLERELDFALDYGSAAIPQAAHVGVGESLWQAPTLVMMNPAEPVFVNFKTIRGD